MTSIEETAQALQVRVHGSPHRPTLVYLPGLHGDWSLVGSFRHAVGDRVRFVEITYPRTLSWSLADYAREIDGALTARQLDACWLLAESFGSQIVWPLAAQAGFKVPGIILAGGFGRHPTKWGVRVAEGLTGSISPALLGPIKRVYGRVAQLRYHRAPEVLSNMDEFFARRTDLDRRAVQHRLKLIRENEPGPLTRGLTVPVYALTGLFDPIVPWWPVRRWLRRECPALCDHKIIWRADHPVLVTAPRAAAEQVLGWMGLS